MELVMQGPDALQRSMANTRLQIQNAMAEVQATLASEEWTDALKAP